MKNDYRVVREIKNVILTEDFAHGYKWAGKFMMPLAFCVVSHIWMLNGPPSTVSRSL